jgi:glycosyltransferase involved in cell wall biosynthesis
MKLLIVASYVSSKFSPFVIEQANSLQALGVEIEYFGISSKGLRGYLSARIALKRKIKSYHPDLIHAHYGLSGLLANLQRRVPVMTTYHGSDIHSKKWVLLLSRIAMRLSAYNIFVSQELLNLARYKGKNYTIQPCGIDLRTILPIDRETAHSRLGWKEKDTYILFAGAFDRDVKNTPLAQAATKMITGCKLIEMKGYTREEVALLMNACDALLLTSFREASPMVIKEAMACGTPIVSTNVGDVRMVMGDTPGCYLTDYTPEQCSIQLRHAIAFSREHGRTNGRQRIIELELDTRVVAERMVSIYQEVAR